MGKPLERTVHTYAQRLARHERTHLKQIERIDEEDQGNMFHYQALAVFIQFINHGVEYRTNITTILSAGQHTSPTVDGWGYLSAHPERFDYEVN